MSAGNGHEALALKRKTRRVSAIFIEHDLRGELSGIETAVELRKLGYKGYLYLMGDFQLGVKSESVNDVVSKMSLIREINQFVSCMYDSSHDEWDTISHVKL